MGWFEDDKLLSANSSATITFVKGKKYEARFFSNNLVPDGTAESYGSGVRLDAKKSDAVSEAGWFYASSANSSWQSVNTTDTRAHSGRCSYAVSSVYTPVGQKINGLEKNKNYVLSFWAYLPRATDTIQLVKILSGTCNTTYRSYDTVHSGDDFVAVKGFNEYGNRGWVKFEIPFNSKENTSIAYYIWYTSQNASTLYMDDIAVYRAETLRFSAAQGGNITAPNNGVFQLNSTVSLSAAPLSGNTFSGWYNAQNGKLISTQANYSFKVTQSVDLQARFNGENTEPRDILGLNGFENGYTGEWEWWYRANESASANNWCSATLTQEKAYSGQTALQLMARHRDSLIKLKNVTPNTDYILSFYLYLKKGAELSYCYVSSGTYGPQSDGVIAAADLSQYSGDDCWRKVTLRFNSAANTELKMGLRYLADSGPAYIDDMQLVEYSAAAEVENGSFTGGLTGWKGNAAAGSSGAELAAGKELYQYVRTVNNQEYLVTYRVQVLAGGKLTAGAYDPLAQSLTAKDQITSYSFDEAANTVWEEHSFAFFSADNDFVKLAFKNNGNATAFVTNVSLKAESNAAGGVVERIDFENGRYTVDGAMQQQAFEVTNSADAAYSGTGALHYKYSAATNTAALYQDWNRLKLSSVAEFKYTLSFQVKFANANSKMLIAPDADFNYATRAECTVTPTNTEWMQVTYRFVNSKMVPSISFVLQALAEKTKSDFWVDNITLKVVTSFVKTTTPEKLFCQDFYSLVENGDFEESFASGSFNGVVPAGRVQSGDAYSKQNYLRLNAGERYVIPITVKALKDYTLAAALRANGNGSGFISVAANTNGALLPDVQDLPASELTVNTNEWQRKGVTFNSGSNTTFYLVLACTAGTVDFDAISFFEQKYAYMENPNLFEEMADFDYDAFENGGSGTDNGQNSSSTESPTTGEKNNLAVALVLATVCACFVVLQLTRRKEVK